MFDETLSFAYEGPSVKEMTARNKEIIAANKRQYEEDMAKRRIEAKEFKKKIDEEFKKEDERTKRNFAEANHEEKRLRTEIIQANEENHLEKKIDSK